MEGARIRAERLLSRFKDRKLSPKQRQDIYLECQLLASFGILKGITLLADMMSYQDVARIKNPKTGTERKGIRRVSYMEFIWDRLSEIKEAVDIRFSKRDRAHLAQQLGGSIDDVPKGLSLVQAIMGLDQKVDRLEGMLHDIGVHQDEEVFADYDANGVLLTKNRFTDPVEFFEGEEAPQKDQIVEVVDEDDEDVLSQDEAEKIRKRASGEDEDDDNYMPEEEEIDEDESEES